MKTIYRRLVERVTFLGARTTEIKTNIATLEPWFVEGCCQKLQMLESLINMTYRTYFEIDKKIPGLSDKDLRLQNGV